MTLGVALALTSLVTLLLAPATIAFPAALSLQQHDQQPTDPAVAIEKRMDRLELRVGESGLHHHRQVVGVQKPLQGVEAPISSSGGGGM